MNVFIKSVCKKKGKKGRIGELFIKQCGQKE